MADQQRKDEELRKDGTEQQLGTPEGFDNSVANSYINDKGDMGKHGSMQEQYREEEGFFTMDEDESKKGEPSPGDVWRDTNGTD
ncbi:MAG: hypothetical protein EOP56_10095 [Sphingobacteriales bacterium]|nr:MAG: hypothetical protein EOP56_10095 [Sphingobacteriales bacterium]